MDGSLIETGRDMIGTDILHEFERMSLKTRIAFLHKYMNISYVYNYTDHIISKYFF